MDSDRWDGRERCYKVWLSGLDLMEGAELIELLIVVIWRNGSCGSLGRNG